MRRGILKSVLLFFGAHELTPHRMRPHVLRLAGVRLGKGVRLFAGARFTNPRNVLIGERTFLNVNFYADAHAFVRIGADVQIADHVRVLTATHEITSGPRVAGPLTSLPVTIGDGAWIGSGATLLPGVEVGQRSIIAAGAVVISNVEPGALYAGVPARLVRRISPE